MFAGWQARLMAFRCNEIAPQETDRSCKKTSVLLPVLYSELIVICFRPTMKFEAHGNISFTVKNQCIINRPSVPFNKEGIEVLFDAITKQVCLSEFKQWCLFELLTKEAFPTPDAVDAIITSYNHYADMGCTHIHVVCSRPQKGLFRHIATETKIPIQFYTDETEAFAANQI